ncbi:MAG: helix-turn-helix domain-containing protein [Syntrophobacteraceae bacterium]|jgi:predicted DNA-binding transcriptional regulator AlpA
MQLLTPAEVKKMLKCSLPWIYKAASTGVLPCVRIPCPGIGEKRKKDMVRFKQEDIFVFIENHYRKR